MVVMNVCCCQSLAVPSMLSLNPKDSLGPHALGRTREVGCLPQKSLGFFSEFAAGYGWCLRVLAQEANPLAWWVSSALVLGLKCENPICDLLLKTSVAWSLLTVLTDACEHLKEAFFVERLIYSFISPLQCLNELQELD